MSNYLFTYGCRDGKLTDSINNLILSVPSRGSVTIPDTILTIDGDSKNLLTGENTNIKVRGTNGEKLIVSSIGNTLYISISEEHIPSKYFPLTNTPTNPVYGNTGNTGQSINGQSYTFVPNDGLYFDDIPTNFSNLFRNSTISDNDISEWKVSSITNMSYMFYNTTFNGDISKWNVSNVKNMSYMFDSSLFDGDISKWNVGSVTNMDGMFQYSSFNGDISEWDVSSVSSIYMYYMFRDNTVFNQDLSSWCASNKSTKPPGFDTGATSWVLPRPIWGTCPMKFPLMNTSTNPVYGNTGNTGQSINGQSYTFVPNDGLYFDDTPTNFSNLFRNSTISDDIYDWDVSSITNMSYMFYNTTFNGDIFEWDVSNVTDMYSMFEDSSFNGDISKWNVSNVTDMWSMFYRTPFNQDISEWNVGNVTNMWYMFGLNTVFNQDLSSWCVSNIPTKPTGFDSGATSWVLPRPIWGTCP